MTSLLLLLLLRFCDVTFRSPVYMHAIHRRFVVKKQSRSAQSFENFPAYG